MGNARNGEGRDSVQEAKGLFYSSSYILLSTDYMSSVSLSARNTKINKIRDRPSEISPSVMKTKGGQ